MEGSWPGGIPASTTMGSLGGEFGGTHPSPLTPSGSAHVRGRSTRLPWPPITSPRARNACPRKSCTGTWNQRGQEGLWARSPSPALVTSPAHTQRPGYSQAAGRHWRRRGSGVPRQAPFLGPAIYFKLFSRMPSQPSPPPSSPRPARFSLTFCRSQQRPRRKTSSE